MSDSQWKEELSVALMFAGFAAQWMRDHGTYRMTYDSDNKLWHGQIEGCHSYWTGNSPDEVFAEIRDDLSKAAQVCWAYQPKENVRERMKDHLFPAPDENPPTKRRDR